MTFAHDVAHLANPRLWVVPQFGDKVAISRAESAGLGSDVGDRLAIYDQFQTDMSPGGYWLHTSVDLATTPLLLKKIFM